jgi:hypothetical protein
MPADITMIMLLQPRQKRKRPTAEVPEGAAAPAEVAGADASAVHRRKRSSRCGPQAVLVSLLPHIAVTTAPDCTHLLQTAVVPMLPIPSIVFQHAALVIAASAGRPSAL